MPANLVSLAAILLATGLFAASSMVLLMALGLLRPQRMTDGRAAWLLRRLSPGDLGLGFENSPFKIRDASGREEQIILTGWWIAATSNSDRCVIVLHEYGDAKVGVIAWAPVWHFLGFHILALDLRAHGESGGRYSTAGFFERHDLSEVIDRLRAERPDQTRRLFLFGVGLGAAVAAAAAVLRDDLCGVILDTPFADFEHRAAIHMNDRGYPGAWLQWFAFGVAEGLARADFSQVRPADSIPNIRCPLMVISPAAGVTWRRDAELLAAALHSRTETTGDRFWSVPGAGRLPALAAGPEEYQANLSQFVLRALSAASSKPLISHCTGS